MDLGALAHAIAGPLIASLVVGVVLAGLAWGLLRAFPKLTAATSYLLLLLTLLAIPVVPALRGVPLRPAIVAPGIAPAPAAAPEPEARPDRPDAAATGGVGTPVDTPNAAPAPGASSSTGRPLAPGASPASAPTRSASPILAAEWRLPQLAIGVIAGLWLLGLIAAAVRLARGYLLLARCRSRSRPASERDRRLLARLKERAGVTRPVECRTTRDLGTPMAAGFLRPVLFLPETLATRLSEGEREQVLLHELAHLARRDDWTQLLQRFVQATLFFHPAVHWLSRRLDLERELACDDWVVARQEGRRKAYAACLLKVASLEVRSSLPAVEGSAVLFRSQIERRITLLLDRRRIVSERVSRLAVLTGLITLVATGVGLSQILPSLARAQDASARAVISPANAHELVLLDVIDTGSVDTGDEGFLDLAFSPDGTLLAGAGFDSRVRVWDVASRAPVAELVVADFGRIYGLEFSPDGRFLATADGAGSIRFWDVASWQADGEPLRGDRSFSAMFDVAFSPDGTVLASANRDGTLLLWDVATRSRVGESFGDHAGEICEIAFSPDGSRLASASDDGTVRLWDVASRQLLADLPLDIGPRICGVAFSPDGRYVIGGDAAGITVWDATTFDVVGDPLGGHDGGTAQERVLEKVAFHPDGSLMATASRPADTVIVWDPVTWEAVTEPLRIDTDGEYRVMLMDVEFSPDGTLLAASNWRPDILLWGIPPAR